MLSKLYKLFFDLSVCFSLGAFLLGYFAGIKVHSMGYLLLLAAALLSVAADKKRGLRILVSAGLPAAYLAYEAVVYRAEGMINFEGKVNYIRSLPELLIFLLIWAYLLTVIVLNRLTIQHGDFMDRLKRLLYLSLIMIFPILTAFPKFRMGIEAASPYLTAACISAIFLLRHLRAVHQLEQMKLYRRQQLFELLAFLLISLLLTLAKAPQNLLLGIKQLYLHIIEPLLSLLTTLLGMLIYGIINLIIALYRLITNDQDVQNIEFVADEQTINGAEEYFRGASADLRWLIPLLYALGAILGMVLLFIGFRWLMGQRLKEKLPAGVEEIREDLEDTGEKHGRSFGACPKTARGYIRYYYRKLLLRLQHKKIPIGPSDTTREISEKYLIMQREASAQRYHSGKEASWQLTNLYRKARYQMTEEITEEEAEKARRLYQELKKISGKK